MTNKSKINIIFGGDFCPVGPIENGLTCNKFSAESIFGNIKNEFDQADLRIFNLETPLTEHGEAIPKTGSCFRATPNTASLLRYLGINVATLANNHIRDYGNKGVVDTLTTCKDLNIKTIGAGKSTNDARNVLYLRIKERRLAFLNYTENEFANATVDRSGANPFDLINILHDLTEAKTNADHVVIIIHGGLEYMHYPSPESVKVIRFLAEQKPTAIIRHHPHYVQGYEVWNNVPIFYSLGNFLAMTKARPTPSWQEGALVQLEIHTDDSCSFQIHLFDQCKHEIKLSPIKDPKYTEEKLSEYNRGLHDHRLLQEIFDGEVNKRRLTYLTQLGSPNHLLLRVFRKLGIHKYFIPNHYKQTLLSNYIRCEAHREVITKILEK